MPYLDNDHLKFIVHRVQQRNSAPPPADILEAAVAQLAHLLRGILDADERADMLPALKDRGSQFPGLLPASTPSLAERAPQAEPTRPAGWYQALDCGPTWLSPGHLYPVSHLVRHRKTPLPRPERRGLRPIPGQGLPYAEAMDRARAALPGRL